MSNGFTTVTPCSPNAAMRLVALQEAQETVAALFRQFENEDVPMAFVKLLDELVDEEDYYAATEVLNTMYRTCGITAADEFTEAISSFDNHEAMFNYYTDALTDLFFEALSFEGWDEEDCDSVECGFDDEGESYIFKVTSNLSPEMLARMMISAFEKSLREMGEDDEKK